MDRILKGFLLFLWILGLSALALGAYTGVILEQMKKSYEQSYLSPLEDPTKPPAVWLDEFIQYDSDPPPLARILDTVIVKDAWRHKDRIWKKEPKPDKYLTEYRSLYLAVYRNMKSLARSRNSNRADDYKFDTSVIPSVFREFREKKEGGRVELPGEAKFWINEERERNRLEGIREELANTFLILIALGAFGSLIFLIKDYMEAESMMLAAYMFRPIWGMFLALAMFILDIVAHSLISEGTLSSIRHETLYALALAAGLLSEQAYGYVVLRANQFLNLKKQEIEAEEGAAEKEDA